jgi:hypothetical protein
MGAEYCNWQTFAPAGNAAKAATRARYHLRKASQDVSVVQLLMIGALQV